jgi:hypothetical protein
MNRMLADAVVVLNKVAAIVIIIAAVIFGFAMGINVGGGWALLGAIVGLLIGVLIAGTLCGMIALLALIEGHLRTIAGRPTAPAVRAESRKAE